jgi:hypothetical protein
MVFVEVSKGELIDKITILEIKKARIVEEEKLANVRKELDALRALEFPTEHKEALKKINEIIWDVEERLRALEAVHDFGEEFVEKARMVYKFNDARASIKKEINIASGSNLVEEKSYTTNVQRSSV